MASSRSRQFEPAKAPERQMLCERYRAIKMADSVESRLDRMPRAKLRHEKPRLFVTALDQQIDRPRLDFDFSQRLIVARQNRAPDRIDRISEPKKADRRMGNETYSALVLGTNSSERCDIKRYDIGNVQRPVHRPLQFGDISQIDDRLRLRKRPQKIGKLVAKLVEPRFPRRMFGKEELSGAFEELLADQSLCHGKGEPERLGQAVNDRITINVQPIGSYVPGEHRRNRLVIPVNEACLHRCLQFKQRRHDGLLLRSQ